MRHPDNVEYRWRFLFKTFDVGTFAELSRRAAEDDPDNVRIAVQYAEALGLTGHRDGKLSLLRDLVAREAADTSAQLALGVELLRRGRYREGWAYYRARAAHANVQSQDTLLTPERQWSEQPLAGKRMLLLREQGLGDTLQFIRYSNTVRDLGAHVFANVQPALRPFLRESPAAGRILGENEPVRLDYWYNLMDLVPVFHASLDEVVFPGAYVAPPTAKAPFSLGASTAGQLRVGLAWSGNPSVPSNPLRSIGLTALAPLRKASRCAFYSLMPPERAVDIAEVQADTWITDLSGLTTPFDQLARAVAAMDVVVSVCTSIAHLAAAMGKPTLILLSKHADWRWGLDRRDSPWYPSATLLRQRLLGDWSDPVAEAAEILEAL